jgi:glycosyltransferase involved in cell wall biosynthesis
LREKNKILIIAHYPPPIHGSSLMGKYIKDSFLINRDFEIRYINLSTSKTVDEIGKKPFLKILRYIIIYYNLIKELFRFKPKGVYIAINAKGIGFYKDFPVAILAKVFRKRLILHYHNKGVSLNQHKFFDNLMYSFLFSNTKLILLSELIYKDFSKYVDRDNVYICPNGIPVPDGLDRLPLNVNKTAKLLFLGNLIESKGIYVLLEALSILKKENILFWCNIVGGEGDITSNKLNSKINDFNLQNCTRYLGKKYKDEKYQIFSESDIFVNPTFYHNESFPLVNLEAMMFGLPVISTTEGGIPDMIVNGETGFIVERNNVKALVDRIKFLIENPEKSKQIGEMGRLKFHNTYTIEIFENKFKNIITEFLA